MSYAAIKQTYLNDDKKTTFTVYHPAIKFEGDKEYCYFPDDSTRTGLLEYDNKQDALNNAKELYDHYILSK